MAPGVASITKSDPFTKSPNHQITQCSNLFSSSHYPKGLESGLSHFHAPVLLAQRFDRWLEGRVLERRTSANSADHDVGNRILIAVLPDLALHRALDVRAIEHLMKHGGPFIPSMPGQSDRCVPADVGRLVLQG